MGQTLKGQHVRILRKDPLTGKFLCYGNATSCTINQSANTDEAAVKNDVGMASRPTVTSRSAQIQIETLTINNAPALLAAIKAMTPFTLMWDEVSTTDNQTPVGAGFARQCDAYLSDLTLNMNDRENTATSLQLTAITPPTEVTTTPTIEEVSVAPFTKGQFYRLFLGNDASATPSKVIAAAKSLSCHISVSLEDSTTKDTPGNFQVQEPTGISFDISTNALIRSGGTITSSVQGQSLSDLQTIFEASEPVRFEIANVSGANQRTKGNVLISGLVTITALNLSAQVKSNATYDATLTGYGEFTVGEDPAES